MKKDYITPVKSYINEKGNWKIAFKEKELKELLKKFNPMKKPPTKKRVLITLTEEAIAIAKIKSIEVFNFVNVSGYIDLLLKEQK